MAWFSCFLDFTLRLKSCFPQFLLVFLCFHLRKYSNGCHISTVCELGVQFNLFLGYILIFKSLYFETNVGLLEVS